MDRRRFLATGVLALGAGLFGRGRPGAAGATGLDATAIAAGDTTAAAGLHDLAIARGDAKVAVARALQALGGMERFVRPDQVVVIKPNASFPVPPAWGATTHPDVLSAVIESALAAGARRVLVVDHTMGQTAEDSERAFRRCGAQDAVAIFPKARLVSLDDPAAYAEIAVPNGRVLRTIRVPLLLSKADVFINLPKAKSHAATGVSLGLKNLMGLIWDRHVFHSATDIHEAIADLATVLRPDLTILDATQVLLTGGPAGPGEVAAPGVIVAGVDPVAVDAWGVGLAAWDRRTWAPDQIGYLRRAAELGVGSLKLDEKRIARLG